MITASEQYDIMANSRGSGYVHHPTGFESEREHDARIEQQALDGEQRRWKERIATRMNAALTAMVGGLAVYMTAASDQPMQIRLACIGVFTHGLSGYLGVLIGKRK